MPGAWVRYTVEAIRQMMHGLGGGRFEPYFARMVAAHDESEMEQVTQTSGHESTCGGASLSCMSAILHELFPKSGIRPSVRWHQSGVPGRAEGCGGYGLRCYGLGFPGLWFVSGCSSPCRVLEVHEIQLALWWATQRSNVYRCFFLDDYYPWPETNKV